MATTLHQMFPDADYEGRLDRARALAAARGAGALLVSVGADLPYLTGYEAMPLERLTMLVVQTEGDAVLVVPRLEAARVPPRPGVFMTRPWDELEDPVQIVGGLCKGIGRALLGDQTWARFLLELQAVLPKTRFESATPVTRELRMRKDDTEIAFLAEAAAATDRVVATLTTMGFAGRTEKAIATDVQRLTVAEGHDVASFAIVASGPNAASPHHEPTDRVIKAGDTVVVDFGGRWKGYCSDTTRTFVAGEASGEVAEAFAVLHAAQSAARAAIEPGVPAENVDAAARSVIADAGYGEYFIHRTGHGIGLEVHEHPYIVSGNAEPLEPGMAFSVEPGIYVPGRFGMRIEDIVVCTPQGVRALNDSPRQLTSVA